jgi:hypothetical protein
MDQRYSASWTSPFTGQIFFRWRHFALVSISLISPCSAHSRTFPQHATGQIFKDDINGFSSTFDIRFMVVTFYTIFSSQTRNRGDSRLVQYACLTNVVFISLSPIASTFYVYLPKPSIFLCTSQSNELTRGQPELIQHFRL